MFVGLLDQFEDKKKQKVLYRKSLKNKTFQDYFGQYSAPWITILSTFCSWICPFSWIYLI